MESKHKDPQPWWQTAPGLIKAVAGLLTAVAGLVATLHQFNGTVADARVTPLKKHSAHLVLGDSPGVANSASTQPQAQAQPEQPSETAQPPQAGVTILQSGQTVSFIRPYPLTIKVIKSTLTADPTNPNVLALTLQCTNQGGNAYLLGEGALRILLDGSPLAPVKETNLLLLADSAKQVEVDFELPPTAKKVDLQIKDTTGNPDEIKKIIPLDLTPH